MSLALASRSPQVGLSRVITSLRGLTPCSTSFIVKGVSRFGGSLSLGWRVVAADHGLPHRGPPFGLRVASTGTGPTPLALAQQLALRLHARGLWEGLLQLLGCCEVRLTALRPNWRGTKVPVSHPHTARVLHHLLCYFGDDRDGWV